MTSQSEITNELLLHGLDDFAGLWWLIGYYDHLPDTAARKQHTLSLIEHLLTSGLFVAGFPESDGRTFSAWQLPPTAAVNRIAVEWEALGREPTIGDVAWFHLTPTGETAARALIPPRA